MTGGALVKEVLSRNPWESNECLFNSTSAPGTPLITELIVVADKAAVWELTDNKDCVGKIKSAFKGRDYKKGTLFPIRQRVQVHPPVFRWAYVIQMFCT